MILSKMCVHCVHIKQKTVFLSNSMPPQYRNVELWLAPKGTSTSTHATSGTSIEWSIYRLLALIIVPLQW